MNTAGIAMRGVSEMDWPVEGRRGACRLRLDMVPRSW